MAPRIPTKARDIWDILATATKTCLFVLIIAILTPIASLSPLQPFLTRRVSFLVAVDRQEKRLCLLPALLPVQTPPMPLIKHWEREALHIPYRITSSGSLPMILPRR